ncbi:unnamed protein product [Musa acuminata subsp. malaccensis]|uniref:(wild Malaysian banana) hypothetical protein n=1 Tax=Musa acuminata subsp. malaccensis TaxID=214687 RepID=A0A804KDG5_MUSAM|nr:PREDICTED: F-box protein At5g39450-like [Musa acuminata subsp. malaccensis]CAG1833443.1 unnamed protein product [Musa acuminata subsp. malaccensis]
MSDEAAAEVCGSGLFLALPDDVLAFISGRLGLRDLFALALCCRGLWEAIADSEKIWFAQCCRIGPPPHALPLWREGVDSYFTLCRFLASVEPLLGVWVHQNPELRNVVCVLWGFLSVVGVSVIPQEVGPLGLDSGPLLWAPVFEVLADADGAPSRLFLHGRGDRGEDRLYPGTVQPIDSSCNVLLLEVDVRQRDPCFPPNPPRLPYSGCFSFLSEGKYPTFTRHLRRLNTNVISSPPANPFSQLSFSDRNWLLNEVADTVALEIPSDLATAPLFERCSPCNDTKLLAGRWSQLTEMHMLNRRRIKMKATNRLVPGLMKHRSLDGCDGINDHQSTVAGKRKAFFSVFENLRDEPKQYMSRSMFPQVADLVSSSGNYWWSTPDGLLNFLMSSDSIGLSLKAAHKMDATNMAWPDMSYDWFALYKLPMQVPTACHEHAGLWGGTFGWPFEDKPEKALFLVLLSYEEVMGHRLLIATKILEGTQRLLYPNGSPMFTVRLDEAPKNPFPWGIDRESPRVKVKKSYNGEGVVTSYGFLCSDLEPGALYVLQNGLLAFVWEKSDSVITLQRIVLQELLRKGERVPMLPPTADFSYFTKSYSNMFAAVQNG